jgi:hypothetical protein
MRMPTETDGPVFRQFDLRAQATTESASGGGRGTALVMGTLDAYRSVWSPRAFPKAVLAAFVANGFISRGHNIREDVATIDSARVSRNQIDIEWSWHSTDDAQEQRTKVGERLERGKGVGLSVGTILNWEKCCHFDSGEKLWTYCDGLGEPMELYDPAIRKHKGYCWIIPEVTRLVEVAITLVPAVDGSRVDQSRSLNDLLHDPSLLTGLRLEEHLQAVRTAVVGLEARLVDKAELAASQDRAPFTERLPQIEALRDSLSNLIERCQDPTPQAEPDLDLDQRVDNFLLDLRMAELCI